MDWSPLLPVAVGGAIAAVAGYLTQWQAGKDALRARRLAANAALNVQLAANDAVETRDRAANWRHDQGIIRQVKALLRDLQQIIGVGREAGMVDIRKWTPSHDRLRERIALADVALALSDDIAESVYGIAFVSGVALQNRLDLETAFNESPLPRDATDLQRKTRATIDNSWKAFETAWAAIDDQVRLEEWRTWNDRMPPIA